MIYVQHPLCNASFGAPADMQVNCGTLPIKRYEDANGSWSMSFWRPDAEELAALAAGGCVTLHVRGPGHPVVRMATMSRQMEEV